MLLINKEQNIINKKDVELITKQNEQYSTCFYAELIEKGLTQKTVQKHINNGAFYINDFLNYYAPQLRKQGCYQILIKTIKESMPSWLVAMDEYY